MPTTAESLVFDKVSPHDGSLQVIYIQTNYLLLNSLSPIFYSNIMKKWSDALGVLIILE